FASSATGLTSDTTYYFKAYAENSVGVSYGDEESFKTLALLVPSVTTGSADNITVATASLGGQVTNDGGASVTVRGVCWNTAEAPDTDNAVCTQEGAGTGSFASSATGLTSDTTYYFKAYAENSVGVSYGDEESFKTLALVVPVVTTGSADNITMTTASLGGQVMSDGGASVTVRGVCWNTAGTPDTDNAVCTDEGAGTGSFTSSVKGLTQDTTYYFKAYAENSVGLSYGNEESFKTLAFGVPVVTTGIADNITMTAASLGGQVISDGGISVTVRGVCWNTAGAPDTDNAACTQEGAGTGSFTSSVTGLIPNTTYYFKAYAENSVELSYGDEKSFITQAVAGDVNWDGFVDIRDAVIALKVLAGIETEPVHSSADANGDGKVGIEDVMYILRKVLEL
ncbi:MAG: hypothetical protein GY795_45350, partial [Desulfobacterales bacterium]|nr:hypothetical protein [Desulfobacterales bacterium]